MQLTATVIRDFAALGELERSWIAALQESSAHSPTAVPAWSYGLMARHVSAGHFQIVALHDQGRLALCMPYRVERGYGRPVLRAACEISPVFCPAPSAPIFTRLFDVLTALHGRHALAIDHAEGRRSDVAAFIAAACQRYPVKETRRTDANVLIDLFPDWDVSRAGLSANAREAIRRARLRVQSLGLSPELRVFTRPDEMAEAFGEALSVDARSWKYVRGGAMALSANEHVQFAFAFQRFSALGQARVFLLRLNGRAAAFILAIVMGSRAYMAVWSYADEFSACSPGRLIMEGALKHLAAEGVAQVDFWGRPDTFKSSWSNLSVDRHSLMFHPDRVTYFASRGLNAAAAPFRYFLQGNAEGYRLRQVVPAPVQRALLPLKAFVSRRRLARTAQLVELHPQDRAGFQHLSCRPATEPDKPHIPRQLFGDLHNWKLFEQEACLVAAARVEAWPDGSLYVSALWQARADPELTLACAVALLRAYPQARYLREPKAQLAFSPCGSLGMAILAWRSSESR